MARGCKLVKLFLSTFMLLAPSAFAADSANIFLNPGLLQQRDNDKPSYQLQYVTLCGSNQNACTDHDVVQVSLNIAIKSFKNWFNVEIQITDQLVEVAAVVIADYFNKLRQCLPGIYRYPMPNILFGWRINNKIEPKYFLVTSTIHGMQNGKCRIETSINSNEQVSFMQCAYSPLSLSFFTDNRARRAAKNNLKYNKNELEALQKISGECEQLSLNGPIQPSS